MRHVSCGTLEELRNTETALIDNGFKRVTSNPSAPLEYCLRDDCVSTDCQDRFILIWEMDEEWYSESRQFGSQRLSA